MADAYRLIIQRARGGAVGESDFAQIADVTGFAPGAAWTFSDTTAYNYGELIGYRARWVCVADATVFSDWSGVVWARSLAPVQGNNMAVTFAPVTAQQIKVGMGVERYPGQAVQAAYGLDMTNVNLTMTPGRATSMASRNSPSMVTDETPAYTPVAFSGDIDMRQAGGVPRVLMSYYELDTTYGTSGITTLPAAGGVPQNYIAKLIPTLTNEKPISITDLMGKAGQFVVSGLRGNTLNLTSDKQGNEIFRASVELMGLGFARFPADTNTDLAITGINSIAYENSKYGPTDWGLFVGGLVSPDCRSVTFNMNRNLQEIAVGNFLTGASAHVSDGSAVTLTTTFKWRSLAEMKQYLGVTDQQVEIFGQTKEIPRKTVEWRFNPPKLANGFQHNLSFFFPDCSIGSLPIPAQDSGVFEQTIGWIPRQDFASNNFVDHYILITTTENPALWSAPQPEMPVYPAQSTYAHNAVPGTVASGNATTFVSTANAYLAATDNTYNGLVLQFTTGALAGQRQTITGYVASSRTFTVGTAFTASPAVNDLFIVIGGYGKA